MIYSGFLTIAVIFPYYVKKIVIGRVKSRLETLIFISEYACMTKKAPGPHIAITNILKLLWHNEVSVLTNLFEAGVTVNEIVDSRYWVITQCHLY